MSRPAEYENGAPGSNIAFHPVSGGVQGPPSVYHPQEPPAPSYEEYADPAAAHGWENAYDETAELPAVVPPAGVLPDLAPPDVDRPQRRAAPGHRARRRPSRWRSPRAAVAGAVGVVSVAAVIAGFSLSGSSSGGPGEKEAHTGPSATDLPAPTGQDESTGSGGSPESPGGASVSTAPAKGATTPGDGTSAPTTAAATSAQPSAPATTAGSPSAGTTYAPGNSGNNPGHGKRPR